MIVGDAMKKKVIGYLIILLFVPLLTSLVIAITTDHNDLNNSSSNTSKYDGINIPDYSEKNVNDNIKKSDTYVYFSIFVFVIVSGGILFFIKKERGI